MTQSNGPNVKRRILVLCLLAVLLLASGAAAAQAMLQTPERSAGRGSVRIHLDHCRLGHAERHAGAAVRRDQQQRQRRPGTRLLARREGGQHQFTCRW